MSGTDKKIIAFLGLIVFFCVISISLYAIRSSTDEFWHLKTGEYIVQHGFHLPQKDIFTYTAADMDWVNHEWLSQVVFYYTYLLSGFHGFVVFKTLIILFSFIMVYRVCRQRLDNPWICLFAVLLGALTSRHTLYPRPFIFSYLLVPIYLYYLYDLTSNGVRRIHYLIFPILMIFWVNLHGGAILGLLLIGFFLAGAILEYGWDRWIKKNDPLNGKVVQSLFLILELTMAASLLNPYGWKVFELTAKVMGDKMLVQFIGELQPPDFHFTTYYLAMLIITGLVVLVTFRKLKIHDFFLLAFFGQQSFFHVRHLPLFGITAASIMAVHLGYSLDLLSQRLNLTDWDPKHPSFKQKILFSGGILWMAVSILFVNHQLWFNWDFFEGPGYREDNYPVKAADYLMSHDVKGHIFNQINCSGYLMFRLNPKYRIFTDNRFDLFGSKFMPDFYMISEAGPDWQKTLEKYQITCVLINFLDSSKLNTLLENSQDWVKVYQDSSYVIYVKNSPLNQPLIEELKNHAGIPF